MKDKKIVTDEELEKVTGGTTREIQKSEIPSTVTLETELKDIKKNKWIEEQ